MIKENKANILIIDDILTLRVTQYRLVEHLSLLQRYQCAFSIEGSICKMNRIKRLLLAVLYPEGKA